VVWAAREGCVRFGIMVPDELATLMLGYAAHPGVQVVQTRFRKRLVDAWRIEPGARVLEIGCGQGETTVVLADVVGPAGHVVAVDPAPQTYGTPVTLGQSAQHLSQGPLGNRIDFRFGWDPEGFEVTEPFDALVMAHCSWYFASVDQLQTQLAVAGRWANRLCFSEWDMHPYAFAQVPHYLAVLAQGQFEAWQQGRTGLPSTANIRTPLSRQRSLALITAAGWTVRIEEQVDSSALQDGGWEIAMCRDAAATSGLASLVGSQFDVLHELAEQIEVASLNSYAVIADRADGGGPIFAAIPEPSSR
jgi:SAM-dependent methyltransferase